VAVLIVAIAICAPRYRTRGDDHRCGKDDGRDRRCGDHAAAGDDDTPRYPYENDTGTDDHPETRPYPIGSRHGVDLLPVRRLTCPVHLLGETAQRSDLHGGLDLHVRGAFALQLLDDPLPVRFTETVGFVVVVPGIDLGD